MIPVRPVTLQLTDPENDITTNGNGLSLGLDPTTIIETRSEPCGPHAPADPDQSTERLKCSYLDALSASISGAVIRLTPIIEELIACGISRKTLVLWGVAAGYKKGYVQSILSKILVPLSGRQRRPGPGRRVPDEALALLAFARNNFGERAPKYLLAAYRVSNAQRSREARECSPSVPALGIRCYSPEQKFVSVTETFGFGSSPAHGASKTGGPSRKLLRALMVGTALVISAGLPGFASASSATPSGIESQSQQPLWRVLGGSGSRQTNVLYNVRQKHVLAVAVPSGGQTSQHPVLQNLGATPPPDEIGPDYRVWRLGGAPVGAGSSPSPSRQHRIVQVESGMNYWDGTQWSPSDARFEVTPAGDAFVANRVDNPIRIASNLNTRAAVTAGAVGGASGSLQCTPVAVALYDSANGDFAVIGSIRDCSGVMMSSNTIVFGNAFDGVCADVVYTLERGCFQQDVVMTGRLDPSDYGFPPATTRVQIISEVYGAPNPQKLLRPLYVENDATVRQSMATPDLVDEVLTFGNFVLGTGRAFMGAAANTVTNSDAIPVAKQFVTAGGRNLLIESVVYTSVKAALLSLPTCQSHAALIRKSKFAIASLQIPSAGGGTKVTRAINRVRMPSSSQSSNMHQGLTIDFVMTAVNNTTVFQGDTTYFVSGPVYCNLPVTIEGGAVFKYPNNTEAFIEVTSSITLATTSWRPAIFTAGDDESIGDSLFQAWSGWTGTISPGAYYANPAISLMFIGPQLSNLRFSYCQEGVRAYVSTGSSLPAVWDCQLIQCVLGVHIEGSGCGCGSGGGCGTFVVNNCLFGQVQYPIVTDYTLGVAGVLTECTFDHAQNLLTVNSTDSSEWDLYNSILSTIGGLLSGCGGAIGGNYNGFFASPSFGSVQIQEDPNQTSPFAPTEVTINNQQYLYVANGQGAYYLRDGSPFVDAGNPNYLGSALQADIALRTTVVPMEVFDDDINSSETLYQQPIRDNGLPDLGFHYAAADYIMNGATVNNCTLNVDQGVVIAFVGNTSSLYEWELRVNPGGRLNVNGVPTNRVVFAYLEGIQESPNQSLKSDGTMIGLKELFFTSGPPSPFPEANVRYSDFPCIAGGFNVTFGPINYRRDPTYSVVQDLEFHGCLFQGGGVYYDDGGPQGRPFGVKNNVFERADLEF